MDKQTHESLQDLHVALRLLEQCEARVLRVPNRFKNLYLSVPVKFSAGLRSVRVGVEELACQLVQMQNLPSSYADVSLCKKSKKSRHS